jgi:hypothetical protein
VDVSAETAEFGHSMGDQRLAAEFEQRLVAAHPRTFASCENIAADGRD